MPTRNAVLIMSGVRGETRRYRNFHPYEQLQLAGIPCELSHITDRQLPAKMDRAAVVLMHRIAEDAYVAGLRDRLRRRGGLAISDVDDLVFDRAAFGWIDSPDFQDPMRAALYQENLGRNRRTLEQSDAGLASTDYLAGRLQDLGLETWVHRNAFSLEMLAIAEEAYRRRQQAPGRTVIGYASGTPTHDQDFSVARPALREIMQRHPEVELWLIGPLDPGAGWGELSRRIRQHKLVPWRKLPRLLAQFDINLAPLVMDNPFSQSKSEIKYMEAALVRVPTIASPTDAFRGAIRHGENGLLAASTEDWLASLSLLLENPARRREMADRAFEDARTRYHPRVRARELVAMLNAVSERFRGQTLWPATEIRTDWPSGDSFWVSASAERSPTLAGLALYSLRHRGPRTFLMEIWIYLRRLAAPLFPFREAS